MLRNVLTMACLTKSDFYPYYFWLSFFFSCLQNMGPIKIKTIKIYRSNLMHAVQFI